jgi:DNA polymerase V
MHATSLQIIACYPFRRGPRTPLPLLLWQVSAGFPSPAEDHIDKLLDLNELVVRNEAATFMMRVSGRSMEEAGISDGDIIVVDRSREVKQRAIVIAYLDGEFTVKRIAKMNGHVYLVAEHEDYEPIIVTEEMDFIVWGVVTHVISNVEV